VILNRDQTIIYVNNQGLKALKNPLEAILGQHYNEISIYPTHTPQDPIDALEAGREAEVLYLPDTGQYIRGAASYLTGKNGEKIGYIIVTTDLTELVEQQKKLEQAVNDANQANAHKGDFLARMSHEIRTPMNAIIGMTSVVKRELERGNPLRGEIQNQIEQIETSSQHLLGLLNDILDISKIEAGKIELAEEAVDLLKLANTVVTIIQSRCDEKHITFETRFDVPNDRDYISESLRLRQVLINLLGNAVKFTPEGGRVSFTIIQKEQREGKTFFEFTVGDTGIGISEKDQQDLFKPFEQANSKISKKYGGTGLGLAISKNIVTLLGGDIRIHSKEWEGSEFTFELWMTEIQNEKRPELVIEEATDIFRGKRALLVDDVPINRIIAANLLEFTGLAIDEADDGLTAIESFSKSPEHTYDIIYMDIRMPNMNGYEATAAIRAMDRSDAKTIPIVALTANAFKEDVDQALQYGMNAHLAKPMDAEKLLEVTLKCLGVNHDKKGV
jgi:signal transduction histidine kinase/ActR/RegA family two-component response regulator